MSLRFILPLNLNCLGSSMKYFAYGSNMSIARLKARVPSAVPLGCYRIKEHDLRFHKSSKDGSGKCDAFFTGNGVDVIFGALFEINSSEKAVLDRAEGLGSGYDEKEITVISEEGLSFKAITYFATDINLNLKPYSWYLNHVLIGASETSLPNDYIQTKITVVESIEDKDRERDAEQRAIHS